MTLSEELHWRGQIKDKTFENIGWLDEPKTFYLGVDGSSASMTIGNLAVFMLARRLLDHGWTTVLLVGGATSLIGDPGGKDEERTLKSREEIEANIKGVRGQVKRLFSNKHFTLVDNYDWFKNVVYLDFLRDVGKHFSMTELLQRDYIADRIGERGSGISYAEFSYTLIQGYDFWYLHKNHGVVLQIGGSDQWGNMLSGVPLIRKKENAEAHAMSAPLVINKTTGKKFGKSEDGAIWLEEKLTSVYRFYQFWLNVDDESVVDYLKIYTLLSKDEIDEILEQFNQDRASRKAQKTLAYEVTKLVHGQEKADSVVRVTSVLFGNHDYAALTEDDFNTLKQELPIVNARVGNDLIKPLVDSTFASSNSEAMRFLEQGSIYINGKQIGIATTLEATDRIDGKHAILRRGKNNNAIIQISE